MNDDELRGLLRIADDEGAVPDDFRNSLWHDVDAVATGSPTTAAVIALPEGEIEPIELLTQPDEPVDNRFWMFAAAAAVCLIAFVGAVSLLRPNNESNPVASDSVDSVAPDPTTSATTPSTTIATPNPTTSTSFATEPGITAVSASSISLRFVATEETVFTTVLRSDGEVVTTEGGTARAGEAVTQDFDRLNPQTSYTLQVTLLGPPAVMSAELETRTAGDPNDPRFVETPIEVLALDVVERPGDGTFTGVIARTNVCSIASLVILDASDQTEVARAQSDQDVCTTEHALNVDLAATPLLPDTAYVAIVSVEEFNTSGRNTTTDSIEFNTGVSE